MISWSCLALSLLAMGCAAQKNLANLENEKLQGTWNLVYQQMNGKKLPDEQAAKMLHGTMVFARHTIRYTVELQGFDFEFAYTLLPNQQPKAIDLELTDAPDKQGIGLRTFGIYQLEGDDLRICHSKTDRPEKFEAPEGSHNTLIVLTREHGASE